MACLNEENVAHLRKCIQLNLECVAICEVSVTSMSLDGKFSKDICTLCAEICDACAEECEKHASMGMEHCKECAEACRACADACRQMMNAA